MIDVSSYPGDTLVPWFRLQGEVREVRGRGNRIDVRPNWNEAGPGHDWRGNEARPGGE